MYFNGQTINKHDLIHQSTGCTIKSVGTVILNNKYSYSVIYIMYWYKCI